MINPFTKLRDWFRRLPDKKQYIEVITATLSIPVLLSVIFMNYMNIQQQRQPVTEPTPTPKEDRMPPPQTITIIGGDDTESTPTPSLSPTPTPSSAMSGECLKEIGPIAILSPSENQLVTRNPFEINIQYDQGAYCSAVWSYRIDSGAWSDFIDADILVYNLNSGTHTIELRVKSVVTSASETLTRTFTYQNSTEVPTPTDTQTPTPIL